MHHNISVSYLKVTLQFHVSNSTQDIAVDTQSDITLFTSTLINWVIFHELSSADIFQNSLFKKIKILSGTLSDCQTDQGQHSVGPDLN